MTLDPIILLLAVAAIVIGSTLQRVSGAGVGLVVAPTLALLLGPSIGVLATNIVTIISATTLTIVRRREIEWRRAAVILLAAVPGAVAGALLVRELSAAWLQIVIGAVVLIALAVTVARVRGEGRAPRWAIGVAGAIGGLFNTTAGIAAPALVVYSRIDRWRQPGFGATLQPIFLGMGALSVAAKTLLGATGFGAAPPPWWTLLIAIGAVLAGVLLGRALARRVTPELAGRIAMAIAAIGGIVALVRGAGALLLG